MFSNGSSLLFLLIFIILTTTGGNSQQLPYFTVNPESVAVDGSVTVELKCELNDSTNITIQWMVNDTIVNVSNSNYAYNGNNLVISNFDNNLNGNYTCLAVNNNWTLRSATADVRRAFLETSHNNDDILEMTVPLNSEVIIPCNPVYNGYPLSEIEYEWRALSAGGEELEEDKYIIAYNDADNEFRVSNNGTLVIAKVIETEQYQCTIELGGTSIYYRVRLLVDGTESASLPHIIFPPENMTGNVGDTVIFDCIAGGESFPEPIWTPPGNVTNFNTLNGKTEMNVNSVTEGNEGQYSCQVPGINTVYTATLIIRDPPVLTVVPPITVNITYGQSQSLTCIAIGNDILLVWYHNGIMISNNNTINITNATLSHAGAYQCFAIGPTTHVTHSTLITINTIAPLLLPNGILRNQIAFSGKNLTLSCQATGAPDPTYMWMKGNADASSLENFGFILDTPGSLILPNIVKNFEGMYTCIARTILNGINIGEDNSSAEIIVTDPTDIMSVNPITVNSYIGDPFHLNCTVTHDTATSVSLSWTRNGTEITNTNILTPIGGKSLLLNITSASYTDQGVYQCVAKTEYTVNTSYLVPMVTSTVTTVTIASAPIEPTVTLVTAVGPNILQVSWTYKGFKSNLKEYQIEYQEVSSSNWINNGTHPITGTTVRNITGLIPFTQYNVRIIAILKNDEIVYSPEYGPTTTNEDVPSNAPDSSRIDVIQNSTLLTLEWQAPTIPNGVITDYTIRYWYSDTRINNTVSDVLVGGNNTRFVLTGLIPMTEYQVQIAAHTQAGIGPFSDTVDVSTVPTVENVSQQSDQVYTKIWFIVILAAIGLLLVVVILTVVAILRWKRNNKGNMYTVRNNYTAEDISLTEDVVADYNKRRERPMGFTESVDGSRANLHMNDTQLDYPSFGRSESFRGSIRGSFRGSIKGLPPPPEYINPPSFEETLKARLARNRSASTTLLEKVDHSNFRGSGWSVGHDPKSTFFLPTQPHPHDPDVDSMVGKPRFSEPGEETSGESDNTSTGLHTQSVTNVESFAQFV